MAELVPIPLPLLVERAFREYEREGKIFDLPKSKFFTGQPGLDFSVLSNGHTAATPLGPAAGPHGQLAQNIALSWLGGSRIIELKTVQILDELTIPRPCIDVTNVGYNVEWSQELKLEQSLREYVGAAMLIEILKASHLLGEDLPPGWGDTIFDMSVGYNLEGIGSTRVRAWLESMKDATAVVDHLRHGLTSYRDLDFPTTISDTVTLSTFHGCPAREIEGIVTFLLTEMDLNVCIKLNPTLLGRTEVERLLHDVMGYHEIQVTDDVFGHDLRWDELVDLLPRLERVAEAGGKRLSVKLSNTLVVKNHRKYFKDEVMYMSGPPLHVLTMNLVQRFHAHFGDRVPVSFSGGMDQHNFASVVAMNLIPATTCTDLLRPGGYSRLIRYLENLGARMRELGATNIQAFQERFQAEDATENPRYRKERNQAIPRKIGSKLWFYDCINCDKCVPVCPNDANFTYESKPQVIEYDNFELQEGGGVKRVPGGVLRIVRAHQLANYADACNDCGNCDIFCPEDGGPHKEKPRFYGSQESYEKADGGFYMPDRETIHGRIEGRRYVLKGCRFWDGEAEAEIDAETNQVLGWVGNPGHVVELLPYLKLKLLREQIANSANYISAFSASLRSLREP